MAAGQALVVGLSWYRDCAFIALHADREGLPDVQRLAEAIQPSAVALDRLTTAVTESSRQEPLRVNAGDSLCPPR
ncbi:MAG: hypothetical protein ACRDRG_20250 [Pseudonocardiaceae bacterium]